MRSRLVATLLTASALAACLACSDSTGPGTGITGTWHGSTLLPNGYTTTMVLEQNGTNVTGTLRIAGVLGTNPLTGEVSGSTFTWTSADGCEVWSGTLTLTGGGQMNGPVVLTTASCAPARQGASGTMSLTRG